MAQIVVEVSTKGDTHRPQAVGTPASTRGKANSREGPTILCAHSGRKGPDQRKQAKRATSGNTKMPIDHRAHPPLPLPDPRHSLATNPGIQGGKHWAQPLLGLQASGEGQQPPPAVGAEAENSSSGNFSCSLVMARRQEKSWTISI